MVCLLAARASRLENQDAIDAAIVGMLADPKEVRARFLLSKNYLGRGDQVAFSLLFPQELFIRLCISDDLQARANITEVHFLPFNPVDKRTALTYIDSADGKWYRASKGAPEQVLPCPPCL